MKNRFRAWNPEEQKMYFPDWIANDEDGLVAGTGWEMWQESHKTHPLMLSTGLKDTNGKMIFDGDIVTDGIWKRRVTFEILASNAVGFWISRESSSIEIIGNKYGNPDLWRRVEK